MKTFEGLVAGTIITNPTDGGMMISYTTYFSEDDTFVQCLENGKSVWPAYQFDPRDWEVKSVPYYWLDLNYNGEDAFALWRGFFDADGEKDRQTEEVVCDAKFADLGVDAEDLAYFWDTIDKYIEEEIGFCPDYEVM